MQFCIPRNHDPATAVAWELGEKNRWVKNQSVRADQQ